jgi:catechol 2,3-dioxygenase-like lactoylglutathione lyase family enzyme
MLQRLFHVNICVRDMERSIRFYQDLGFTKVSDFTLDDPSVGDALGVQGQEASRSIHALGQRAQRPRPRRVHRSAHTRPALPTLNNVGICRIAFTVDDIDKTYEELRAKSVEFVAPLKKLIGPGGAKIGVVCFKDPDGAVLELMSGM